MPKVAAPMRSPWSARRLRSRTVNCSTGSTPCWARTAAQAKADICALAPAPSVTFTASARPFRQPARSITADWAAASGGEVSAVMTKAPLRSSASSRPFDLWLIENPCARRSGVAAIVDEPLQPRLVVIRLQPQRCGGGLGLEIIAAIHRLGATPLGEIRIRIAKIGPHRRPVDRLLEALGELALGGGAAALDDHLSRDVTPIDDDQLRHGRSLLPCRCDSRLCR